MCMIVGGVDEEKERYSEVSVMEVKEEGDVRFSPLL